LTEFNLMVKPSGFRLKNRQKKGHLNLKEDLILISTAYAMGQAGGQGGQAGGIAGFLPLIILFAIFYFLLIRPQQKKAKEHREMIANLKKGNRIITSGGIYGTIQSIDDTTIGLEIAEKVKIKVTRGNVAAVVSDHQTGAKKEDQKK
jgi:preprotein translocase subunit YajC